MLGALRDVARAGQPLRRAPGPRPARAAGPQRASSSASRRELGLPLVATNDVHYAERADAEAHLYLSCIKTGRSLRGGQGAPPRLERDVPEVARGDGRSSSPRIRRPSRRRSRSPSSCSAVAQARRADAPELRGARGLRHRGVLPPRRARGPRASASGARAAGQAAVDTDAYRTRLDAGARRHREDEVPRVLPHRLGLHPLRQGERASPWARGAARARARSSPTRCGSPTSIPSRTTSSSSASSIRSA